jgi:hypothetical protein
MDDSCKERGGTRSAVTITWDIRWTTTAFRGFFPAQEISSSFDLQ